MPKFPLSPLPGRLAPPEEPRPDAKAAPDPRPPGWRINDAAAHYRNPWIGVWEYQVTRPDGQPGLYGVVHFRARAAGVVAIADDGCTILVGQHRVPGGVWSWEIPEGGVGPDESMAEGIARELQEEAGWRARSWQRLMPFDLSNSVTDETGELFLAWDVEEGRNRPDDDEDLVLWRLPLADAVALVDQGVIRDIMSVAALMRVDRDWATGTLPQPLKAILGPHPRGQD